MSRRGEAALALVAVVATAAVTATAGATGYIGPFADVFVLGILWWVIRAVGEVKVLLASQPTRNELAVVTSALGELKDGIGATMDRVVDRASNVVAQAQERMLDAVDNEARRRHQLRDEYEANKELVNTRLTQHGEKIAELGARVDAWPPRRGRS